MSYYFEMRFLPVSSREEAFRTGVRFANAIASGGIARKYLQTLLSRAQRLPQNSEARIAFIQAAFQTRFAYWPQYKLLGLLTKSWPEEVFESFSFSAPIQFQDNTDQDYPLETWPDNISAFAEAKKYVAGLHDEVVRLSMGWDDLGSVDQDYARRSLVYKEIFRSLDLRSWEQGETGAFERFALSSITTAEQLCLLSVWLKTAIRKFDEEAPGIRLVVQESAYDLVKELPDDSIQFLLEEIKMTRKAGSIRPGSYLAGLVSDYKANHECTTDIALKEVEAGLNSVLAKMYLEMREWDEDARKNGWLYYREGKSKDVKIVRGNPENGDAWDFAVTVPDWGELLILGTFPNAKSARDFVEGERYVCVADESQEAVDEKQS